MELKEVIIDNLTYEPQAIIRYLPLHFVSYLKINGSWYLYDDTEVHLRSLNRDITSEEKLVGTRDIIFFVSTS